MSKAQTIRGVTSVETVDKKLAMLLRFAYRLYEAAIKDGSVASKLIQNTNKDIDLHLEHRLVIDPFHSNMSDTMSKLYSEYIDIMRDYKLARKQVKNLDSKIKQAELEVIRLKQLRNRTK